MRAPALWAKEWARIKNGPASRRDVRPLADHAWRASPRQKGRFGLPRSRTPLLSDPVSETLRQAAQTRADMSDPWA